MYLLLSVHKEHVLGRCLTLKCSDILVSGAFLDSKTNHTTEETSERFLLPHRLKVTHNGKGMTTGGLVGSGSPRCLVMRGVADHKQSTHSNGSLIPARTLTLKVPLLP